MVMYIVVVTISNVKNSIDVQEKAVMILEKTTTVPVLRPNTESTPNQWSRVASVDIVPGDVVCIEPSLPHEELPFDAILLSGSPMVSEACFGSAEVICKLPVPAELCNGRADQPMETYLPMETHYPYTLFQGSRVLQPDTVEPPVLALVTQTGINTRIGSQVWRLLQNNRENENVMTLDPVPLAILAVYAGLVAVASLILLADFKSDGKLAWRDEWGYTLYTLSQTISPLLSLCVSRVTRFASANRLKAAGVYLPDVARIPTAGSVDVVAVTTRGQDTLTLTTPLTLQGAISASAPDKLSQLQIRAIAAFHMSAQPGSQEAQAEERLLNKLGASRTSQDDWSQRMCKLYDEQVILRLVELSKRSNLSMALTATHKQGASEGFWFGPSESKPCRVELFCQGSCEAVTALCDPSTLPEDVVATHLQLQLSGYRVYTQAVLKFGTLFDAYSWLEHYNGSTHCHDKPQNGHDKLSFIGFAAWADSRSTHPDGSMVFTPETNREVEALSAGRIPTMILSSQDVGQACFESWCSGWLSAPQPQPQPHPHPHPHPPLYIGTLTPEREPGWTQASPPGEGKHAGLSKTILSTEALLTIMEREPGVQLAMTAEVLDWIGRLDLARKQALLSPCRGSRVFAKMSQADQESIVRQLSSLEFGLGLQIATCGANMPEGLISICANNAASSGFATFITHDSPFHSVSQVIREGRACVAGTIALFQFIVMYGILFSVTKLTGFYYRVFMTHGSYVYIDCCFLLIAVAITLSKPAKDLVVDRPPMSLHNRITALSIGGSMAVNLCFWLLALLLMDNTSDYVPWPLSPTSEYLSLIHI
eukprot:TRINITY_DN6134_c0_g1_i1.p1 TRINITY_DN6134_c0_g1~~TRINITY_DN6134_c0_g1_i1.p1  ORF type:complete len:822 (+),score=170.72 TRINITY_DN6134_c0_g1_i1:637-3102(+)